MDESIKVPYFPQKSPAEYFRIALDAIKKITGVEVMPDQEALLFIEAGKMCDLSGDWDQALESYEKALEQCEGDDIRAEILKQMGHIRSKRGEWDASLEAYEASLEILERLGDLREVGNIYNSIGYNCFETGDMTKAGEYYNEALEAAQKCDDVQLISDVQNNLGILANVMGEPEQASKHYQQSILGYEAIGDVHGLAQVYHNLGMTYVGKKNWELAGEYYQRSMDLCTEIGDIGLMSIIYANKAQFAMHLHAPYVAKLYCDKAFEIFDKTGNKMGMAEAYKLYGVIYSGMQEWDSAETAFQKGLGICEEYNNRLTKAEILYERGLMKQRQDEKREAIDSMQGAIDAYESLGISKEIGKVKSKMQEMMV